ncbi:MAG TPA: Trm112 family protein [Spirochaetota bacterium]|jgi:hypothetical protein|nr:Trm112 family protein [Spirochaetota bacterium]HPJ16385.1 Trm112 family protein [Spirochaetota bacterium]HQO22743.1 Trm112 family protein [Spirochaetota bacterium]HQQ24460.1 Trm112 family protein [Spirochaetota bacterium]
MDKDLLDILACPKCKGDFNEDVNGSFLVCEACGAKYPVVENIPVLLESAAIMPEDTEIN